MRREIQTPAYQQLLEDFDSFIRVRNYRLNKGRKYQAAIKDFLIWLEDIGVSDIKQLSSRESVKYYEHLTTRPKKRGEGILADKTVKFHLFTLGLFMLNLLENQRIEDGFYIPSCKGDNGSIRNVLTVEEIRMAYQHCQSSMEKALLSVAYGCGLRRSEIEALNAADIQFFRGMLIVRNGKNSKRREVPMSDSVIIHLKNYLTGERYERLLTIGKTQEAFFINAKGQRCTGTSLNDLLKSVIESTGSYELIQKNITLHCLRHSIAHSLAENNAGIEFIRRFLGHADINTTYIYAIQNKKKINYKHLQ